MQTAAINPLLMHLRSTGGRKFTCIQKQQHTKLVFPDVDFCSGPTSPNIDLAVSDLAISDLPLLLLPATLLVSWSIREVPLSLGNECLIMEISSYISEKLSWGKCQEPREWGLVYAQMLSAFSQVPLNAVRLWSSRVPTRMASPATVLHPWWLYWLLFPSLSSSCFAFCCSISSCDSCFSCWGCFFHLFTQLRMEETNVSGIVTLFPCQSYGSFGC